MEPTRRRRSRRLVDLIRAAWTRPVLGTGLLLLLSAAAIASTVLLAGMPVPRIHDEFAYLLTGDTFAHGRLTNATHPFWRHFETFQVIHQPSYQGKYPPAQGLFLAIGYLVGQPIVGVWISVAMLIGASVWALRALLDTRWALFAALLLTLELGTTGYWAQSYWGGAVAAGGGALVFGACARLVVGRVRPLHGILGGIGLALLANSRPLEGLLLTIVTASWVGLAMRRQQGRRRSFGLPVLAALALGTAGVAGEAAYDHAVTGEATTLPYTVHERTYPSVPVWMILPSPTGHAESASPVINHFYDKWAAAHRRMMENLGPGFFARRLFALLAALGPGCVLLVFLPSIWSDPGVRAALAMVLVVGAATLLTDTGYVHYFAPAVAPAFLLIGTVARRRWKHGTQPLGRPLVVAVTIIAALDMATPLHDRRLHRGDWANTRQAVLGRLRRSPGRDLVFVHYPPEYEGIEEWVYNRADIDAADVVWARTLGRDADAALVDYFADRRVWDVEAGQPIRLTERKREERSSPGARSSPTP